MAINKIVNHLRKSGQSAGNKLFALYIFSIFLLQLITSCRSDKPGNDPKPQISLSSNSGVFIINEGNFQFGNSSISYYNENDKTVLEDLYKNTNNVALGDVCQSMYIHHSTAYLVVNNSKKIEVVNSNNLQTITTINGFVSPRYFLPVSNGKAYVSDLHSNYLSIINLSSNTISGQIPCKGWSEEMMMIYGKVFVTNMEDNKLWVVDAATDLVQDSITLTYAPSSLTQDKNGKLWVLCVGDSLKQKAGGLYRINPIDLSIEQSFNFTLNDAPRTLKINPTNDTLYYINRGLYQLPVSQTTLPSTAFITKGSRNFYGLGINPKNGIIYVADAIDYIQKGKVYCYTSKGNLINSFNAGLIPNGFCFR